MSIRKISKILAYSAAAFIALLLIAIVSVYVVSNQRLNRKQPIQVSGVAIPSSVEAINNGKHIVATRACAGCHGDDFGGKKVIDDPLAGKLHGPNITRGNGGLPADYTDLDYVRAIRHGLSRDGRSFILMPSIEYADLSDEDLGAVIAYLKTLPAVDRPRGPVSPGPLLRALLLAGEVKLAAEHIDHTASHIPSVVVSPSAQYGKYLASSCMGCHGPNLSGGKIPGAPPDWPAAANLTHHSSGRLAQWTEAEFMQTVRTRRRPDGTPLNEVMPAAFAQLTDVELKALWAYLKTLPATPTGAR
jgi:cytochrome c553